MAESLGDGEQKHPNLNLSADEKRLFGQVFAAADAENLGVVTGDMALKFFPERTKLPSEILGEIWQIADTEDKGFLTPAGFGIILRLIGYAQAGRQVSAELALKAGGPLPKFAGINAPATGPAAPLQAQPSGGPPIRVPPLAPDKANSYATLFEHSGAQDGLLPGVTAKSIFDRAQLPNEVLAKIWSLADTEQRGMLNVTEFIIAMHLLASYRAGTMRALPQTLPTGLYEAATRRGIPPRQASGSRPTSDSAPISAIQRQFSGVTPARTSSPLTRPPQAVASTSSPQSTGDWAIGPAEKAQYDNQFAALDTTQRGSVTGDQAVGFFSRSSLPEDDLAQIWDLADINSAGQLNRDEFAVAMHLIRQQLTKRGPLPQTLPANLVPPSMRRQIAPPFSSTAPAFAAATPNSKSAAMDLFGLDAFSDQPSSIPISTPALQPQSTGASATIASSPIQSTGTASPSQPRSQPQTLFKPFVPTSSFGQTIVSPQTTGLSSASGPQQPPQGQQQPRNLFPQSDDLLGDTDPEVSKKLTSDTTELANLSNQVGTLTTQMQQVQQKRSATEQDLAQVSAQKRDFETRLAQLRSAYEQEAREVKKLEDQVTVVRNEVQKIQQDIAMVQHSYQNLQTQHKTLEDQHQQALTALQTEQQGIANLKQQLSETNNAMNQLKPELEKNQSDLRQQKGLVAIHKKQLSTLEAQRDKMKLELDAAAKEHQEALLEVEQSERAIAGSREAMEREREAGAAQLRELAAQRATREHELAAAKSSHEEAVAQRSRSLEAEQAANIPAPPSAALPTASEAAVISPAASVASQSTNPFFRRATTASERGLPQQSISPEPVASPNYNAFDSFFGPPLASTEKSTPPPAMPATSFGEAPGHDERGFSAEERGPPATDAEHSGGVVTLPSPGQIPRTYSTTSSVEVAPPASRQGGLSGIASPAVEQNMDEAVNHEALHLPLEAPTVAAPEAGNFHDALTDVAEPQASRPANISTLVTAPHAETSDELSASHNLPGSFPAEPTPFFTPAGTNQHFEELPSSAHAEEGAATSQSDPSATQHTDKSLESPTDDSAFPTGTKLDKGKGVEKAPTNEFPPIQEFEGDDESDSEHEHGFGDHFTAASPQRGGEKAVAPEPSSEGVQSTTSMLAVARPDLDRGASNRTDPPTPNAQASPPTYDQTIYPHGPPEHRDSNQFPPEFGGLLPSREPPVTSPEVKSPEAPRARTNSTEGVSYFGGVPFANDHGISSSPLPQNDVSQKAISTQPAAPNDAFDDFDNEFGDLTEAHAADDKVEDEISSPHHEGVDEFNPTFDSPAPSRATVSTLNHDNSAFADFESTINSGNTTTAFSNAPAPTSAPHDWDAMFADFGTTPQTNGNGFAKPHEDLINEAFGDTASTPTKPSLGRALSMGTEHDDPILKRLTGMGFDRNASLAALEKYDYNLDKAADYLTSKT